jgi:hypothetical protein
MFFFPKNEGYFENFDTTLFGFIGKSHFILASNLTAISEINLKSNVSYTTIAQLLHNSNNFVLRLTIEYLGPTCRKINPMVDHKKTKKKKKKSS